MTRYSAWLLTCALALTSACGDDPAGPGGGGSLTATVNSTPFVAGFATIASLTDGHLIIDATQDAAPGDKFIFIDLSGVTQAGTYHFGPQSTSGDYAVYGEFGALPADYKEWLTSSEVASGQIVITQLTSSRIAGTFFFTAEPFIGDATGTKTVTNGVFSLNLIGD